VLVKELTSEGRRDEMEVQEGKYLILVLSNQTMGFVYPTL
jgi:hypothetical protein